MRKFSSWLEMDGGARRRVLGREEEGGAFVDACIGVKSESLSMMTDGAIFTDKLCVWLFGVVLEFLMGTGYRVG